VLLVISQLHIIFIESYCIVDQPAKRGIPKWNHKNNVFSKLPQSTKRCFQYDTTRTSTHRSMTIDVQFIYYDLVQNGVLVEHVDILAASTVTAIVALLFITQPPSRLISIQDLNTIVTGTYLERKRDDLKCVYKASNMGWSAIAFHDAVDTFGSGIVVARTITGTTFGGYNPNGWRSTDDYYSSTAAFLWCYSNGGPTRKIVKLPVLPGGNCAIFDYATSGPCFGAAALMIGPPQAAIMGGFAGPDSEDISKSAGNLRQCKSSIGSTYRYNPAWPIRGIIRLSDIEVYCLL
jgi:TLD